MNKFAEILLPLPLTDFYTYAIPSDLEEATEVGKRVLVQFGKKKLYTGIIWNIKETEPPDMNIKEIIGILDDIPVIDSNQKLLWEWIAEYYCCSAGEVFKAGLPQGLKLESDTSLSINFENATGQILTADEQMLVSYIERKNVSPVKEIQDLFGAHKAAQLIKSLLEKKILSAEEVVGEGYKPKFETYIRLSETCLSDEALNARLDSLQKAKLQYKLLISFIDLTDNEKEISQPELIKKTGCSLQVLKALIQKGILVSVKKKISRINRDFSEESSINSLTEKQEIALGQIETGFQQKEVVLLHGVTSSGKTEVYIKLIETYINKGMQVLYLLPEIALTAQIVSRLRTAFGKKALVYHSKFSDHEKVELYSLVKNAGPCVLVGVRSSVFLPFSDLGLVIIDEEHENSFKQYDPAPRYNARDTAIVLASLHKAKTLLGSATPSFESYFNAIAGKYQLVELKDRFREIEMPEIKLAGFRMSKERKLRSSIFTQALIEAISETLKLKEQVILFQNRRGYSPYIECQHCGHISVCKNCDVSLTYHKNLNRLVCHYCGFSVANTGKCMSCQSSNIEAKGFGTEKIEDEIAILFPEARVARLDLDSTRRKESHDRIISSFEFREVDILIGTQMVTKGLHFDHVRLVGIMNADTMLNFPDFRAFERSYQLMAQVSGRAGRKEKRGLVIIQANNSKHPVIRRVFENNYIQFFKDQMTERKQFKYPPFYRLIAISVKHKKTDFLVTACELLHKHLIKLFGDNLSGPFEPLVGRVQNLYIRQFIIKVERNQQQRQTKSEMMKIINRFKKEPNFSSLHVVVDVDPV